MIRVTNENWIIWESSLRCRRRDFSRLVDCGVRAGMRDRYSRLLVSRDWDRGHLLGLAAGWPPGRRAGRQTHTIIRLSLHQTDVQQSNVNTFSLLTAHYKITPLPHSVALSIQYFKKSIVYTPRYMLRVPGQIRAT